MAVVRLARSFLFRNRMMIKILETNPNAPKMNILNPKNNKGLILFRLLVRILRVERLTVCLSCCWDTLKLRPSCCIFMASLSQWPVFRMVQGLLYRVGVLWVALFYLTLGMFESAREKTQGDEQIKSWTWVTCSKVECAIRTISPWTLKPCHLPNYKHFK